MYYITERIGTNYKKWAPGDSVLISSQTGSGKSTFILNVLLPYAIMHGKHIVYFCNRKILEEQLSIQSAKNLSEFFPENSQISNRTLTHLHIVTYQYCEQTQQYTSFNLPPNIPKMSREARIKAEASGALPKVKYLDKSEIMYYVFDEAHYFIADSHFNPNTNFWLYQDFHHSISVFLTATPEPLLCFLACKKNSSYISYSKVSDLLIQRTELRKSLTEHKEIKAKRGSKDFEIILHSAKYINNRCREIQPYAEPINFLKTSISGMPFDEKNWHYYDMPSNYDYIHPIYFSNYAELIKKIVSSNDKWLIFVNAENSGVDLVGRLQQAGVNSVFLSAKTRREKDSAGYTEFCNIVQTQYFSCSVLVATSVLDCGVSISDPAVKNIVIGHPEKTTFMQMLGRRRIQDGESIALYVKIFDAKTINTLRFECEKKLQFLIFFSLRNEVDYDRVSEPTAEDDGMRARTKLSAQRLNQTVKLLPQNASLVYPARPVAAPIFGPYDIMPTGKQKQILAEYKTSQTALISLLYTFSNYQDAVEHHRELKVNESKDNPVFYLEQQLKWLGKKYRPNSWLCYGELHNFLGMYCIAQTWLSKSGQAKFASEFLTLLVEHPSPLKSVKNILLQHKRKPGFRPSKNAMNKVIDELGLPYKIKSKQPSSGDRSTLWQIVSQ